MFPTELLGYLDFLSHIADYPYFIPDYALFFLLIFLCKKILTHFSARLASPFKHRRMQEAGGGGGGGGMHVEFSNRMYQPDAAEELDDQVQPATNFVNPVYETMFLVRIIKSAVLNLF